MSDCVGTWLSVSRMYRGEQLPSSVTSYALVAGGGHSPMLVRVAKAAGFCAASGRGICDGSIRLFDGEPALCRPLPPRAAPSLG